MNKIKEVREEIGMDINKMAELLNMNPTDYTKCENNPNETSAYICYCICNILGIKFSDV